MGTAIRPTIFGEPVPYGVVLSNLPIDAPFRAQILQTFLLSIAGGVVVALLAGHLLQRFPFRARIKTRERESGSAPAP